LKNKHFSFTDSIGRDIYVYKWIPDENVIKAVVQISHGLSENAGRYENFAQFLTDRGYAVYANDHLGHGKTAITVNNLGYACKDGFLQMLRDMEQLSEIIKKEYTDKPIILFGHNMGSFLSQLYIQEYGDILKAVILSGTMGRLGRMANIGVILSVLGMKTRGAAAKANNLNKLYFGAYNKGFKPFRTEFDWLSRDEKEVDKFVKDDFCGAIPSYGFYYDMFRAFKIMHNKSRMENIPKNLPVYLFSGENDPVGSNTKSVLGLIELYKEQKIQDISYKFYKNGRHEMLNEINKSEVMTDIGKWIEAHL
jgi:alpha-beta hydrolase superfamily lysophospholipase